MKSSVKTSICVPFAVNTLDPRGPETKYFYNKLSQKLIDQVTQVTLTLAATLLNVLISPYYAVILPA